MGADPTERCAQSMAEVWHVEKLESMHVRPPDTSDTAQIWALKHCNTGQVVELG
jgi:hypothetical protein